LKLPAEAKRRRCTNIDRKQGVEVHTRAQIGQRKDPTHDAQPIVSTIS
jgi:hypothetical protein